MHCNNREGTQNVGLATLIMATLVSFFNSLFGCFGQSNRPSDHSPASTSVAPAVEPPHCKEVAAIPVVTYGAPQLPASAEPENCTICLTEFACGDAVRVLPNCKHVFHKDCIDEWLPLRSSRCPNCRDRTIEGDVEPARPTCSNSGNDNSSALLILNFTNGAHISSFL